MGNTTGGVLPVPVSGGLGVSSLIPINLVIKSKSVSGDVSGFTCGLTCV